MAAHRFTTVSLGLGRLPAADGTSVAAGLAFELAAPCTASTSRAPFASLASSALSQRQGPAQVPLFQLARAVAETGLRVVRVRGDGRCMFRALALGMARNQGRIMGPAAEEQEADQLRMAVADAICRTAKRRNEFSSAVIAIEAEDKIPNYCKRILAPTFWGGEPELLVLSQMLKVPIFVYLQEKGGRGFVSIQRYGEKYTKPGKDWKRRRPVRLLFTGGNHYDLLLK